MKLSKRMEAAAAMVSAGNILADVGTDHGYIPIELVQRGIVPSAIAMDLREGPLSRAREHIKEQGLSDRITLRLSDGVSALSKGEADTVLIAGMGGELIIRILTDGADICHGVRELILQPQSVIGEVRRFLRENGYRITDEDMVLEDGKFYPMMRVIPEPAVCPPAQEAVDRQPSAPEASEQPSVSDASQQAAPCGGVSRTVADLYGPILLCKKHPVLSAFLERERAQQSAIREALQKQPDSEKILRRKEEINRSLAYNKEAWDFMYGGFDHGGI
jgi:tRNA (adenine22-N1)-methyltransferase